MLASSTATGRQLVAQLLEALQALPGVDADMSPQRAPPGASSVPYHDADIDIRIAAKPLTLHVTARKTVYPRDVQS